MRAVLRTSLMGFLVIMSLSAVAWGQESPDLRASAVLRAIDSSLPTARDPNAPGCAVAVASDTGLIAARYYGLADLEHDVPIGPGSVFHVASLSKQFTALAIAILVHEDRLQLDDSVGTYVSNLAPPVAGLTIRQLLTHTSGIRDQWTLLTLAGWGDDEPRSQDDILWLLRRQRDVNFGPGTQWLYSNSGYTLLAEVVRSVTGTPLPAFMAARVFEPLGMSRTRFQVDHDEIVPGRVTGYEPLGEAIEPNGMSWRTSNPVFDNWGATGLLTTVEDLSTWAANLLKPMVEPEAVRLLRTTPGHPLGPTNSYGLGVVHWVQGGRPGLGHGGTDEGFWSDMLVFTDDGFATIALCNASNAAPYDMNPALARALLGGLWQDPPRADAPARQKPEPQPLPRPTATELATAAGIYHSGELDTRWIIAVKGDSLVALRPRGREDALAPAGPDQYTMGPFTLELSRTDGRVTGFYVSSGRVKRLRFDRVE